MLLYSLPSSFENFQCAIESRDELSSPEALRLKIEENDARRNDTCTATLNAMIIKRLIVKRSNKRPGTTNRKTWNDSKGETFKYKCHRCQKIRHKAADCKASMKRTNEAKKTKDVSLHTYAEKLDLQRKHSERTRRHRNKSDVWTVDAALTCVRISMIL